MFRSHVTILISCISGSYWFLSNFGHCYNQLVGTWMVFEISNWSQQTLCLGVEHNLQKIKKGLFFPPVCRSPDQPVGVTRAGISNADCVRMYHQSTVRGPGSLQKPFYHTKQGKTGHIFHNICVCLSSLLWWCFLSAVVKGWISLVSMKAPSVFLKIGTDHWWIKMARFKSLQVDF